MGFLILLFVAQDSSVSVDIAEYMRQWAIIPKLTFPKMLAHKLEVGLHCFAVVLAIPASCGALVSADLYRCTTRMLPARNVVLLLFEAPAVWYTSELDGVIYTLAQILRKAERKE